MEAIGRAVVVFLGFLVVLALVCVIAAWPVMVLWNWLVPVLFVTVPVIDFWQALGISILCGLLFKSTTTTNSK